MTWPVQGSPSCGPRPPDVAAAMWPDLRGRVFCARCGRLSRRPRACASARWWRCPRRGTRLRPARLAGGGARRAPRAVGRSVCRSGRGHWVRRRASRGTTLVLMGSSPEFGLNRWLQGSESSLESGPSLGRHPGTSIEVKRCIGRTSAESCRARSNSRQCLPETNIGRQWAGSGRTRPNSARIFPILGDMGLDWAESA